MICPKCKFSIPPGQSGCPRCSSQNKGSAFSSQANKSKIASAGASTSEQNEGICGSIKTFFLSEGAPKWQVILLVVLLFGGSFIKSYIASGENEKKEAARTASERNVMIDIDNLVSQNKYEEAIGKCDLIINSASSGDALKCGAIMAKAKSLGYLKKFPEAVKCCDDLLKIWPESASAY
ncbi:MAG TPA: hypothetical protein PKK26_12370, partial [Candidatus Wallbacteria bacterium]|nr:hypothetical protein [Candidatus Wallbacteria bacterium]